jgi:NAD-dependent dihydropyrimidine dehydrogenase PreA subunit
MKWTKPSTRAFAREAQRTPGYSRFDRLHGYVYARWPYLYIGVATREHPLARVVVPIVNAISRLKPSWLGVDGKSMADAYHGKVVPLEAARQLVTVDQEVELRNLEHIIPYARARDIILKNPDHIVALDCPCRLSRPDPCRPVDVCLVIGEPFAGFVVEHHPERARWVSPQEAEAILQAEHDRGHVSHAFFKDAMLDRFYAICNCCSCCCGAMQAWQNGSEMLASSGYVAQVDGERCIGCGTCVESCQFQALSLDGDLVLLDWERCMGCGVCVDQCAQEALALVREPAKGEPLEIRRLMGEVLGAADS